MTVVLKWKGDVLLSWVAADFCVTGLPRVLLCGSLAFSTLKHARKFSGSLRF